MKPRRVTLCHMPKTSVIRFRCDPDIAARFERVAALRRREESDLARIWFEDMILAEEQRLGLVLSTQTPALREPAPSSTALAAAKSQVAAVVQSEVSYRKHHKKAPK